MNFFSEFFFELRRVIPGLAVIAFYFSRAAEDGLSKHPSWSVICMLTVGWLLGFVIEEFMSFVVHSFYVGLGWLVKARKLLGKTVPSWTTGLLNAMRPVELHLSKSDEVTAEVNDKFQSMVAQGKVLQFAEREMSRSLFCVFLFCLVLTPSTFLGGPWNRCFSLFGAVAFGFCWLWPCIRRDWKRTRGQWGLIIFVVLFAWYFSLLAVEITGKILGLPLRIVSKLLQ